MNRLSSEKWQRGLAIWSGGLLAVVLLLVNGVARAEPSPGA
ncbi:MAG: hypothetical protein V9G98_25910 [Candidatus Competibacter sp.]